MFNDILIFSPVTYEYAKYYNLKIFKNRLKIKILQEIKKFVLWKSVNSDVLEVLI
jgi:hypothetical protein